MLAHELDRGTLEVIDLGNGQFDTVSHVRLAEGIRWAIGTQDVMAFGRPIGPSLRNSLQSLRVRFPDACFVSSSPNA
jgi:hypothetical protein